MALSEQKSHFGSGWLSDLLEGLVEVGDEVVDMFGAYRESDSALVDALVGQLGLGQL